MNEILLAVIIVAAIGLLIGLVLAVASIIMDVPKDEKTQSILEVLPGANCGACGFSGCEGYAKALANGQAQSGLCPVGGEQCVKDVAEVMGIKPGKIAAKTAIVNCNGSYDNTQNKMDYQGIKSCSAASMLNGGTGQCSYGCLGFGDCVNSCEYDAIDVKNGVAVVDYGKCKACLRCVKACPKNIISIVPIKQQAVVKCSNCDKAAQARKDCKVGCIGCKKCVKVCEYSAIKVENFIAVIDPEKCTGCGKCAQSCPQSCIAFFET